jgi:hypothetical protein
MLTEHWPEFLQKLKTRYRIRPASPASSSSYGLYLVDFSEWKLSFSDRTPVIHVNAVKAATLPAQELAESLQDVARDHSWRHRECLVLMDGDGRELKTHTSGVYSFRFVIVDAISQRNILAAPSPTGALLNLICEQLPTASLSPYQISAPVEGACFFARRAEVENVLKHPMTNFAITGVRRIGKTSLLREIRRTILERDENPERLVWLDCSTLSGPSQFIEEVVRQLNIRELPRLKKIQESLFSFEDFLKRMAKMHGGAITFFLDEADQFLVWARDVWSPILRASVNSHDCRYIVAGFQNLLKEQYDRRSPFYLSFEQLDLLPFRIDETADVVLQPMRSLRVQIENEGQLVSRIQFDTRGHPQLVQYYCLELIKELDRQNIRILNQTACSNIYASEGFKNLIINAFRDNVGIEDKVLVYALLNTFPENRETFTQEEMYGAIKRHHCNFLADDIDRSCGRLLMAGVFIREGLRYQFAIPAFPRVLKANYDVNYLLSVAKKEMAL